MFSADGGTVFLVNWWVIEKYVLVPQERLFAGGAEISRKKSVIYKKGQQYITLEQSPKYHKFTLDWRHPHNYHILNIIT